MNLEVTSVRLQRPDDRSDRLYAFASIVLNEEFVVHDLRLVEADSGIIIAMPNEEYQGEFRDVAHPITNECRRRIRQAVIEEYNGVADEENQIERSQVTG